MKAYVSKGYSTHVYLTDERITSDLVEGADAYDG